jgi:hypothetical protein
MENWERLSLAEMEAFVENNRKVRFSAKTQEVVHGMMEGVLKAQGYRRLSKGQKGIVRRYLTKITGLSRAQVTRLIQRWNSRKKLTIERAARRHLARPVLEINLDFRLIFGLENASLRLKSESLSSSRWAQRKPRFRRAARLPQGIFPGPLGCSS